MFTERTGLLVARSLAYIEASTVIVHVCKPNATNIEIKQGTGNTFQACVTSQYNQVCSQALKQKKMQSSCGQINGINHSRN